MIKKVYFILFGLIIGLFALWYFDVLHKSDETLDVLIGKNYDYACKMYFHSDPDCHYTININDKLNEFDGGILGKKSILTDSIVHVYTWRYFNHKKTIWVGETSILKMQVIDAIRYNNNVRF